MPVEIIAEDYTVTYAPSGTLYTHLCRQQPADSKGLLALGDAIFQLPARPAAPPLPPGGVLVTSVQPGSNAFRAGLQSGDVLLRYGDTDLAGPRDLTRVLQTAGDPERRIAVIVWRGGKQRSQPLYVRPGLLGVVAAPEPAPQLLAELQRLELVASRADEGDWPPLPGTRFEVHALQRLFDKDEAAQLLLDSEASEQRLDELAQLGKLGCYRYLHLATHGEANDAFPLRSAIILSRDRLPDAAQRTQLLLEGKPIPDGRLTAEEVLQRWHLHCDLVTLSACETALGKYETGEGFVGFAQVLILAGSRSVCLSLWRVDDTATALLMQRFYQNLLGKRDGLTAPLLRAEALAEAKVWLRRLPRKEALERAAQMSEGVPRGKHVKLPSLQVKPSASAGKDDCPYAHPHYWAAFVLIGHKD
jgi:hypothetical protein